MLVANLDASMPTTARKPLTLERPIQRATEGSISIDAKKLATWVLAACVLAELSFVLLDYFVNYGKATQIGAMRRMTNIAREDGLASWFGTTQTLLAGLTLWLTYLLARGRGATRFTRTGWLILAGFFSYMAVDDGAQLHERLGSTVKAMQARGGEAATASFFPSYTWQVVFLPIFVGLGLFMVVFLHRTLTERWARGVVVAAAGCMACAVGLDFVEGLDATHPLNAYTWLVHTFDLDPWAATRFGKTGFEAVRHFSKSIEEALEMFAISLLWFVFLRNLARAAGSLHLGFQSDAKAA